MRKSAFVFPCLALALAAAHPVAGQFGDPFLAEAGLDGGTVRLRMEIPAGHYLYAENLKVTDALGAVQAPVSLPGTTTITDPDSGGPKPVYHQTFEATYAWRPSAGGGAAIHVQYWGCNDEVCFIPQSKVFALDPAQTAPVAAGPAGTAAGGWRDELERFRIVETGVGYLRAGPFLQFLDQAEGESVPPPGGVALFLSDPVAFVRESGLLLAVLFILVGGLALNLTPCVLPMIPINLAIIGAGAQAGSKSRGFALGSAYGAGIALVYGLLGAAVVLTGSQFGTIQANPWFNLAIAAVFAVLALAMFDVLHIDFSRFQSKLGGGGAQRRGRFSVAMGMGAVAALLAGACVAPVVIAVLLLATNIHEAHRMAGLLLPFVLGIGMALPWPFAGAGLSFLPKPGKWMEFVKYGFGVGIAFFALYYAHLGYRAFRPSAPFAGGAREGYAVVDGATNDGLAETLRQARASGRPVFIDFWASWCKNCVAMDKTTFKDEAVKARLERYAFIKYVAEDPSDPETRSVMEHFGVQGLPTYVVLALDADAPRSGPPPP